MDELEKRSEKGLNEFRKQGSIQDVKSSLDSRIDSMFDDPDDSGGGITDDTPSPNSGNKKWIFIALALVALAFLGYKGYQDGSNAKSKITKEEPKVLFAQYFQPMEDLTTNVQRGDADTQVKVSEGMTLYNQKKYKQAAKVLLAQDNPESQVYGALSLLNDGQPAEAAKLLDNMVSSEKYKDYSDIISWYRALCELSIGDLTAAKKQLKAIASGTSFKKLSAKELLDQM